MRSERNSIHRQIASVLPETLQHSEVTTLLQRALAEDLAPGESWTDVASTVASRDVTSVATIDAGSILQGTIRAKADGVMAGVPLVTAICTLVDEDLTVKALVEEGERVSQGDAIAQVAGPGRSLLVAERPALNLLGRCSGIATLTCQYVDAVRGTGAEILDTRKTAPGMRQVDKYAVRQGGGCNHRMGLYDMVLIKDNHIDAAGSITEAVSRVRGEHGDGYAIEVEVKNLTELQEVLSVQVSRIMLDNMDLEQLREAVAFVGGSVPLEASGNVTLDTVRAIADTGVDFISVGALTHSAPAFDVSLRMS